MIEAVRGRGIWVIVLFALGFTVLSARLVFLQFVQHEHYRQEAIDMHYVGVPVLARRGSIRDREGNALAQTITVTDLYVDGKLAYKKPEFFEKLAPFFAISPDALRARIDSENSYILLAREVNEDAVQKLKELKLRPLIFEERMTRVYPNGFEASHILGLVNYEESKVGDTNEKFLKEYGIAGVEQALNKYLSGIPGERMVVRDGSRREIPAYRISDRPPKDGYDVVLTIDQVVQHIVEVEADKLVQQYNPDAVHIIVARPSTGEILALTSRPTYDPNNRKSLTPQNIRNAALMNIYEPGSTFKMVTYSAAMNENLISLDTPIFCENGKFSYAGSMITDHEPYGLLNAKDALAKSSNVAAAKVALLLGPEKMYNYARQFGFGGRAQSDSVALAGEQSGLLHPLKRWTPVSITHVPIGYEVAVTNLQMSMAYCAIANGGKLMEPRLIQSIVDSNGKVVAQFLPRAVRQVIRPETAAQMRNGLEGVVSDEGTAKKAYVKGFEVSGKTGTAHKIVNGGYDNSSYVSSFIGFLPSDKPQVLVSIVVDHPRGGKYYGGAVAAPSFSAIATQVVQRLGLIPSDATTVKLSKEDGI